VGALDVYATGRFTLATEGAIGVGAILAGRSVREIPWTGVTSLLVAAAAGWFLVTHSPWPLTYLELAVVVGVVFLVVFLILYLIERPLRLAGLFALPRRFRVILGAGAIVLAGHIALVGAA